MIRPPLKALVVGTLELLGYWQASASPSVPRPTALAVAHNIPVMGFVGIEEAGPITAPITDLIATPRLYRRDDELTYAGNVCGFVSGSIDAGVTCKDSDRTCMPLHGWLRCCPTTGTATCGGEAIPTACVAFADGGSTGCDSIGASTTCCSETARPFCESLIMTTAGSTAHNIICAGRDRGTEWLPLLATATDDPRLSTSMTSPKSESNSVKTEFTNVPPVQTEINNSGDSDSEGSEESTVTVSVDEPDDSIGTETTTAGSDGNPEAAPATSSNEDKVPVGAIVGGVVGAIAIVSIALLVVWFFRRKQSRKDSNIGNDKSVTANLKGGISATQFRDTAIRKFRSPSSVFLQPQTLPDLPSSPPRGHIGGSRGGVSESKGGGSERPLSPPPPSERFYYGGVPKGVDDSWVGIPSSKPPPSSHPDSNGGFGSWRER